MSREGKSKKDEDFEDVLQKIENFDINDWTRTEDSKEYIDSEVWGYVINDKKIGQITWRLLDKNTDGPISKYVESEVQEGTKGIYAQVAYIEENLRNQGHGTNMAREFFNNLEEITGEKISYVVTIPETQASARIVEKFGFYALPKTDDSIKDTYRLDL
ncbi:MAG: GNAT family N-acetyltransferase [Candidatus Altiarchaeota archaeon]|nr:GNAT family N-acetyltransferase [Candidatus Altiarchaeota archaeon]